MNEVFKFYLLANKLKYLIRTGWKDWHVPAERLESVAEHIYGTCILAIAIDSEYDLDIDLNHVIKMLVCHELEEIIIGDFTPYNKENYTNEEIIEIGRNAVVKVLGGLIKRQEYIELLDEFNAKKTKNAKYAFCLDKFECDIQSKIYDDTYHVDISFAEDKIRNAERIVLLKDNGLSSMSEFFIEIDRKKYEGNEVFISLLDELKKTNMNILT